MMLKKFILGLLLVSLSQLTFALSELSFLTISDIHLDISNTHHMSFEPNGHSLFNDLDVTTFNELMTALKHKIDMGLMKKPQYILLLGDLVGHFRKNNKAVFESEHSIFVAIQRLFPNTPVIYNFGNNDSLVKNYGSFHSNNMRDRYRTPFDVARLIWQNNGFVATGPRCSKALVQYPCVIEREDAEGYYAAYLAPHLRVISLNSILFSPNTNMNTSAIRSQLQWLEEQLLAAHSNQDNVLLLSHIPPGYNVYRSSWNVFGRGSALWIKDVLAKFLSLMRQYHTNILGILAAHTHKDELKMIQNGGRSPTGVYVSAALSTAHGNAPSVRMYVLHHKNQRWYVDNYWVYRFARKSLKDKVDLHLLYDYKKTYCLQHETSINDCLKNVSIEQMQRYYTAGNSKYRETIKFPRHIWLQ